MSRSCLLRIEDESTPYLKSLARDFPKELQRALPRLGFFFRTKTKAAMRSGGLTVGENWPERSLIAQYRVFERLRSDRWKSWRQQGKARGRMRTDENKSLRAAVTRNSPFLRAGQGNAKSFGSGRLIGAARYRVDRANKRVFIGFLNKSAGSYASAVMGGDRGGSKTFEFHGRQAVTPAMRRMFWAAGIPLAKTTTSIGQEERPLIAPVHQKHRAEGLRLLEGLIEAYVLGKSGKAATAHAYRSFA